MHFTIKNILTYQGIVREKVNRFLTSKKYELVTHEWDKDGLQTILCQWSNFVTSETFHLNWDIRDLWFDLGYFDRVDNLNYRQAQQLLILPMHVIKLFMRKAYAKRKADKLIEKIKEKLSTTDNITNKGFSGMRGFYITLTFHIAQSEIARNPLRQIHSIFFTQF